MGHHTHTHRHMDIERYIRQKGWNITRFSCGHFCFSAVLGSKRFMANFTVADSNLHSQTHGHKGKSIGRNLLQRPERRRKWSRLSSHLTPTPTHCIRRGVHTTRNTIEWHSITTQLAYMCWLLVVKTLTHWINQIKYLNKVNKKPAWRRKNSKAIPKKNKQIFLYTKIRGFFLVMDDGAKSIDDNAT